MSPATSCRKRGPKRSLSYRQVEAYARENPTLLQREIAKHFHSSQKTVSRILRAAGVSAGEKGEHHKNGKLKRRGLNAIQFQWETILHNCGLGLDRGISRLYYGRDYLPRDTSATMNYATL
jgi:hypothetical protein